MGGGESLKTSIASPLSISVNTAGVDFEDETAHERTPPKSSTRPQKSDTSPQKSAIYPQKNDTFPHTVSSHNTFVHERGVESQDEVQARAPQKSAMYPQKSDEYPQKTNLSRHTFANKGGVTSQDDAAMQTSTCEYRQNSPIYPQISPISPPNGHIFPHNISAQERGSARVALVTEGRGGEGVGGGNLSLSEQFQDCLSMARHVELCARVESLKAQNLNLKVGIYILTYICIKIYIYSYIYI